MNDIFYKERAIRAVVRQAVEGYASGFSDRHLNEVDDEEGTINMKIHNMFIAPTYSITWHLHARLIIVFAICLKNWLST